MDVILIHRREFRAPFCHRYHFYITQLQILASWLLDFWPKLHFIPPKTKGLLSHVTSAKRGIYFTKEIFFFSSQLITEYLWRLTLLYARSHPPLISIIDSNFWFMDESQNFARLWKLLKRTLCWHCFIMLHMLVSCWAVLFCVAVYYAAYTVDEIQNHTKGTVEQQYISLVLPVSLYAEEWNFGLIFTTEAFLFLDICRVVWAASDSHPSYHLQNTLSTLAAVSTLDTSAPRIFTKYRWTNTNKSFNNSRNHLNSWIKSHGLSSWARYVLKRHSR